MRGYLKRVPYTLIWLLRVTMTVGVFVSLAVVYIYAAEVGKNTMYYIQDQVPLRTYEDTSVLNDKTPILYAYTGDIAVYESKSGSEVVVMWLRPFELALKANCFLFVLLAVFLSLEEDGYFKTTNNSFLRAFNGFIDTILIIGISCYFLVYIYYFIRYAVAFYL